MLARRIGLVSSLSTALFLLSFTGAFASPVYYFPPVVQTVQTPSAPPPSSPGAANSQCSPFFAKCPCNQVPDKKDPNKCIQGTEKNARGYSNTHDCPVGVCVDETIPGKKTLGVCPTANKCEAKITEGEKPQTCDQAGSCTGPNAKPEDQKGKEGGGQPPQMPQMPQGGGGDKGGQPPQTPQPNQDGLNGTSTVRGLDRQGTPVPDDVRSVWEQYTKKEDPFKTGIDTVVDRNNVEKAPEKQAEEEKSILTNFSDQKQLDAETAPLLKRNDRGQNNVSNGVVTEERYENPPRRDATGFAAPQKEDRTLALNDTREQDKENPDSRFNTRTDGPVELKSIIPVLMERLRDLLQQLFIVLSKKKAEEAKKPPAVELPWGRINVLPQGEIKVVEDFPPSKVIPVLQAAAGPYGKPFETAAYTLCDQSLKMCKTVISNGENTSIPLALGKRLENRLVEELKKFPEARYVILSHDHPVLSLQQGFKSKTAEIPIVYPEQALSGPSGFGDLRPYVGTEFYLAKAPYETTTLLVEPGGVWVGSFDPDKPIKNNLMAYEDARRELLRETQWNDQVRRDKAIQKFVTEARELMNFSVEFLPSTATDKQIMEAAVRTRKNR